MEPDRTPDEHDDTQLLAAIDRAWPVPPMTGRLATRAWSSAELAPEAGSLAAPLPPISLPRVQSRHRWQSLTRIAAILALMFSSIAAIVTFNNRDDEPASFSIAAPSPDESGCVLPIRSRSEVLQILKEVKALNESGRDVTKFYAPYMSIYALDPAAPETRDSIERFSDELNDCVRAGVTYYALRVTTPDIYTAGLASLLNRANQSIETVIDNIFPAAPLTASPTADYQWVMPDHQVFVIPDGQILSVYSPDIFGNGIGTVLQPEGDSWLISGNGSLQGPWSTLVFDLGSRRATCDSSSIRSENTLEELLSRANWYEPDHPLVASLSSETLQRPEVTEADARTVNQVVDAYRSCVAAGFDPYQLTIGTEAFFGSFARFIPRSSVISANSLDGAITGGITGAMPSDVTSIVALDDNTALALLAVNPDWESLGKTPGIILVKQNGQWLIDQLAIVESSATPVP